ncbi:MAG: Transposase [Cenarchaeum symbiont of Oopsacas minuta]|nr:Transposase [Cenarchaeum symbiont of Oopsacas minuta]
MYLSNPYQTKAIASSKKKTDKVDAMILADLYRGRYIALCHVPTKIIVEWRHTLYDIDIRVYR